MTTIYIVEVVRFENQEVVKRIECESARRADCVDDGLNINLNHEDFFTRIVTEERDEVAK